ncbi:hypothetical protein [Prevotella sp. AGR2160]|uniref:hypothetical protein n=1 Tax=Prevotella sp. AGR2160 TaxID=1280674 RepID=UPI00048CAAC0|nr:hypothetical protein [Prevotella sp. AGR2160]
MRKYYQRPEVTDVILLPENVMGIDANTQVFKDPSQADAKEAPEEQGTMDNEEWTMDNGEWMP